MTESEMRDAKVPRFETITELNGYIETMLREADDYGKCVYVMSCIAVAAFNFAAHKVGASGFQAGCAELNFLQRTRGMEHGFMILDYSHLLYPQYWNDEDFPRPEKLVAKKAEYLKPVVQKLLQEHAGANSEVIAHWQKLLAMMP